MLLVAVDCVDQLNHVQHHPVPRNSFRIAGIGSRAARRGSTARQERERGSGCSDESNSRKPLIVPLIGVRVDNTATLARAVSVVREKDHPSPGTSRGGFATPVDQEKQHLLLGSRVSILPCGLHFQLWRLVPPRVHLDHAGRGVT